MHVCTSTHAGKDKDETSHAGSSFCTNKEMTPIANAVSTPKGAQAVCKTVTRSCSIPDKQSNIAEAIGAKNAINSQINNLWEQDRYPKDYQA